MRLRALILAAFGGVLTAAVGFTSPAGADHPGHPIAGVRATNGGTGNPTILVGTTGFSPPAGATNGRATGPGRPRAGGSGSVTCGLRMPGFSAGGLAATAPVVAPIVGERYVRVCEAGGTRTSMALITYSAAQATGGAPMIDPQTLALQAYRELPLEYPAVRTWPPVGVPAIVHVPVVLWLDAVQWRPLSATASVPGLSATITATPVRVEWDMGGMPGDDDGPVTCEGPGTPYDESAVAGSTLVELEARAPYLWDCFHLYRVSSREEITGDAAEQYQAEATLVWEVSWSATDGSGGPLPDVERSTTFPMVVGEIQVLNTVVGE